MEDKRYLRHSPYVPYDPNCFTYVQSEGGQIAPFEAGGFVPYEYDGWEKEYLSWHTSCYIHAGLNPTTTFRMKGPDVFRLLSDYSVNSYAKFKVGRSKHVIMCNEKGQVMIHGTCLKVAEDEVVTFWLWPFLDYFKSLGNYNIQTENLTGEVFLYQLGGPKSLQVVEAAAGEDLHDIKFLGFKKSKIAGKEVMIYRIGMCGTLAYEVHGKREDALDVYNEILEKGREFGLVRLGRRAYRVVHTEGGFPQINYHFPFAAREGFWDFMSGVDMYGSGPVTFSGSMIPDPELNYRNPVELGWGHMINFDHDFLGKEALQKIAANPKRQMVTLEWDPDDVAGIYRCQFSDDACTPMEFCEDFNPYSGSLDYHEDAVLDKAGNIIGISSGRMYAPYYKTMISLCSLDTAYAKIGTTVDILWGECGTKQRKIKAKVARYPYVDHDRNETFDTSVIPRLKK